MAGGRPTKYNKDAHPQRAYDLCLMGATDKQLAEVFEVEEKTINNWKSAHPEFLQSLKDGKAKADANVAKSLYERATGYDDPEAVKIFMPAGADKPVYAPYTKHYPPDVTAAIFWLKNRQSDTWRDKHEHDVTLKDYEVIPADDSLIDDDGD